MTTKPDPRDHFTQRPNGAPSVQRVPADGDLVLCTNPIYRGYGIGKVVKVKGDQAKVEFSPTVFSTPPWRSVNWILKLRDLEVLLSPLQAAQAGQWDEAWRFDLRQMAARLLTGNKGGQLGNARTEILPHQIFTAHAVVTSPRRRFLLADEVGLGKTVEAGMVWQALLQRGQARRTLIVAPAGLTLQWQEEMQDKFDAHFEIYMRDFTAVNPRTWDLKATAIASLQTLRQQRHREVLLENRRWDLIIFDEAQHLSAREYGDERAKTEAYRLAEQLREHTDALLLMTATPHQGDPDHSRFRNLLLLLTDSIDFSPLVPTDRGAGDGLVPYKDLVLRTPKDKVTDASGQTVFRGRRTVPIREHLFRDGEAAFYGAVEAYIREGYAALDRVKEPERRRAIGFVLTVFQRLNASSVEAVKGALARRRERLRSQLADIVAEGQDDVETDDRFFGEYEERVGPTVEAGEIVADEIGWIERLLAMDVPRQRKMHELRKLLDRIAAESPRGDREKVLIFTEFRRTQEYIVSELVARHGPDSVVQIHGGMKLDAKRESQRLFRDGDDVRFLVSTEAGGEGINLQFCHVLVNYDLPWNPMRVEQRIGRIYRFGQRKVVQIYNLSNDGTVEDKVREYFDQRIRLATGALCRITGQNPEEVAAALGSQLDCQIAPDDIYRRALVDGDLNRQSKEEIEHAVVQARRAYEIATTSLFRDVSTYSFDRYRRELAADVSLDDLRQVTEIFLKQHGRQPHWRDERLSFRVPDVFKPLELPERIEGVTFDRAVAVRNPQATFFALGHEFVDAMLRFIGDAGFGGLAARRVLRDAGLAGRRGVQFNYLVRKQVPREEGDEYLFAFQSIVLDERLENDAALSWLAERSWSISAVDDNAECAIINWVAAYATSKRCLEAQLEALWDWDEEVVLLNVAQLRVEA